MFVVPRGRGPELSGCRQIQDSWPDCESRQKSGVQSRNEFRNPFGGVMIKRQRNFSRFICDDANKIFFGKNQPLGALGQEIKLRPVPRDAVAGFQTNSG